LWVLLVSIVMVMPGRGEAIGPGAMGNTGAAP